MFVGFYMISLFFFIYWPNRNRIFYYPKGKPEAVSIIVPCYNEEKNIGQALESLLNLNYPKDLIEIIVVDDKSTDNSVEIIQKYTKKYKNIRLIVNTRNSGKAAEPTNIGIKAAKYKYVVLTDGDSSPERDALAKMIGFLQGDEKVAAVTCAVLSKEPKTFMQRLQAVEYNLIAFNRKLLDLVDAVYVTPGPFALYRKSALIKVGLFDTQNMTQDIEIVWRLRSYGYQAKMCLAAKVYSATPWKFTSWFKQRIRWNIGGAQTLIKYRRSLFRQGMLGAFIIPFFSLSLFLGVCGLSLFTYLWTRRLIVSYLSTRYSIYASATILRLQDLSFTPSVLNFFGIVLFLLGLWFTFFSLSVVRQGNLKNRNIFNIMFYLIVYLAVYPFIMITALYKLARGKYSW
jgi:cellulose synthase/poly-beta-1,6-N-acetylglucosamine synthase-like glycosyltransferase